MTDSYDPSEETLIDIDLGTTAKSIAEPNPEFDKPFDLMPPNPDATGPWIKYDGVATLRTIDAPEWVEVGVTDQPYTEWNALNGYKVSVSDLSAGAIRYCLQTDGRFVQVDN
jgi:hypothetical protein